MGVIKQIIFAILCSSVAILAILVGTNAQSGFISIDCGISDDSSYTYKDESSGITYQSDGNFVETGENRNISEKWKDKAGPSRYLNLRSFPEGTRNCYTVKPAGGKGSKYLIRAGFLYGNYDDKGQPPSFDLYLGVELWGRVENDNTYYQKREEIIHVLTSDHIHVCLVNTGDGIPFISFLEIRSIGNDIYTSSDSGSLLLHRRYDYASEIDYTTRYDGDVYDRLWSADKDSWRQLRPSLETDSISMNNYAVPFTVMRTAFTTENDNYTGMGIYWDNLTSTSRYLFYMHFAELEILEESQLREFNVYVNDVLCDGSPLAPAYLDTTTIQNPSATSPKMGNIEVWFYSTKSSNKPPLVNALEIYELKQFSSQETNQSDGEAISNVKSVYGLNRITWQGDPCAPQAYLWEGLNCSYSPHAPPRILSLNLSSSGLEGEIAPSIANMTMLKYLDLSNNNLTGIVPEFLAQLPFLNVLNLKGNNLTGPIPDALLSKIGLSLSLDDNLLGSTTASCSSGSCQKKRKNFVVPILIASIGGLLCFFLVIAVVIWILKKRKAQQESTNFKGSNDEDRSYVRKQQFTYSEIGQITNNFETVLGEGGFGKVYYGYLDGVEVAVKMLSPSSIQGRRQFHAELKLLLRVHHKNLTTLVGYCNETVNNNIGLIYEYMAMGNLRSHLSVESPKILSWKRRLQIAINTAQGLEYLHNGCKPPIVHRDVKSTNILLNEKFQAKLSDFGLSKIFPNEGDKLMSVSVAGTPGYLDPEYYASNWLNEKSDVYSFGVVLLEIITARPVLAKTRDTNHISEWVSSMLANGDIDGIVDPRLEGLYDKNTAWKVTEIAMACVSKTSANRPTMGMVVVELKGCLTIVSARKDRRAEAESKVLFEMVSPDMTPEPLIPLAR